MQLTDLIDLEWMLARDEEAFREGRGADIAARDRAVGDDLFAKRGVTPAAARSAVESDPALRRAAALEWLGRVRPAGETGPGGPIVRGWRIAGWVLAVLSAIFGATTARAVLDYDGGDPVNVFYFLFALVFVQILLLVLLVAMLLYRRAGGGSGGLGLLQDLIVRIGRTKFVDRLAGARAENAARAVGAFRARHTPYGAVEKWTLFAATQRAGVFFNLAALATTLALVVFSDLVFSWSTTLDVTPRHVHAAVAAVGAPFSVVAPGAVPDLETVAVTQWIRGPVEGRFVGGDSATAARAAARWWPFLVLALATWGLFPRLLAWAAASWRVRRELRGAPLDHAVFARLFDRLAPPAAAWEAPVPATVGETPKGEVPAVTAAPVPDAGRGACAVVLWGNLARRPGAAEAAARRFGWTVEGARPAGGADLKADEAALAAAAAGKSGRLVLAVLAGVQPTKEIVSFLAEARRRLPPRAPLVVAIVGAEKADVDQWRHRLDREADPWLRVEGVEAA